VWRRTTSTYPSGRSAASSVGVPLDAHSRHESHQRNGSHPIVYSAICSTSPGANGKPPLGRLLNHDGQARPAERLNDQRVVYHLCRPGPLRRCAQKLRTHRRDNPNRIVIAEGVFGDPRNTSWQTFDTGGGGGNIESRAAGGRRRWPLPIHRSRPSPLRSPRSGDSRSAAVEETFMIAPLVIAAPNTWNGSVPTRWLALGLSPNEAPSGSTRSSTSPASVRLTIRCGPIRPARGTTSAYDLLRGQAGCPHDRLSARHR
jgi:hypothetical protein